MLTTAELTELRGVQELTLTQTAYIRRTALVDDGAGGTTEVATILGPYPCRVGIVRLQRGELLDAGQLRGGLPWMVTLPALTDVRLADDLNVDGAVSGSDLIGGRNFEVLAIYAPASFETARQCVCAEK